jgi:XTP/dITP diphosphohydrolase
MGRVHEALEKKGAWMAAPPPKANFISVLCLAWPGGEHSFYEGKVDGHLVWPPRGGNGFGYDPMFVPEGETRTYGEMEPAEKYASSHRTRAFAVFKREALGGIAPIEAPSGGAADAALAALTAAAANLSTKEELLTFLGHLRRDQTESAGAWTSCDVASFLAGVEKALTTTTSPNEPAWRTMAKALLAGRT